MSLSRRHLLGGLALIPAVPLLAACSETAPGPGSSASAPVGDVEAGALPVTIEHRYGSATIEAAPQRVVCVGLVEQDMLLALGLAPVGTTKWLETDNGAIFPWATEALGDRPVPTLLDAANGIPVEKVAALKPDLIIGLYSAMTQAEYDLLSKLAPTVAAPKDIADYGMRWEDVTLTVGRAVGQPAAAEALVTKTQDTLTATAQAHPEFAGKSAVLGTPYQGLALCGKSDPRQRLLESLGFTFPEVFAADDTGAYSFVVSSERTSDLGEVDVVVWRGLAGDAGIKKIFLDTPTGKEGRYVELDQGPAGYLAAGNMITPLSIPYFVERYAVQLAAAVDGDPATKVEPPAA